MIHCHFNIPSICLMCCDGLHLVQFIFINEACHRINSVKNNRDNLNASECYGAPRYEMASRDVLELNIQISKNFVKNVFKPLFSVFPWKKRSVSKINRNGLTERLQIIEIRASVWDWFWRRINKFGKSTYYEDKE